MESPAGGEPIAVVGLACRLPGADSPEALWKLLVEGRDATREAPVWRWSPGTAPTYRGGFLEDAERFDAAFFGISERQALAMDPQQRLLLEGAWTALEDAGCAPSGLKGSDTGVFVGISGSDYAHRWRALGTDAIDEHTGSGTATSVASGRIAHVLGLRGPTLSVDTACSSSLVAVHLAVRSLRAGDCRMALAGGVSLMLAPEPFLALSRARMLAADGRCKTFSAAADGHGRGEGMGLVVLKRLSDARTDGDRIHALIRGSAINQDGSTVALTAPNAWAQEVVLRKAFEDAGLAPGEAAYIESHGSGTLLGDTLELTALGAVMGRAAEQTLVGSIKSNVGHLEAAAGVAGLLKALLAVRHGVVPPHLHFTAPNPHVSWDTLPLRVPTVPTPWPAHRRRVAGVSSFGFSGTNAHVVIEGVEEARSPRHEEDGGPGLLCLSAGDAGTLRELASRYARFLEECQPALRDVAFSAHTGRAALGHRLALKAVDARQASAELQRFSEGQSTQVVHHAVVPGGPPPVAFVIPAKSPAAGCASELHAREPVFRNALSAWSARQGEQGARAVAWLMGREGTRAPEALESAGAALAHALAALWKHWGVVPAREHPEPDLGALAWAEESQGVVLELGEDTARDCLGALGRLFLQGCEPEWRRFHLHHPGQRISLPLTPFQRRRFWPELQKGVVRATVTAPSSEPPPAVSPQELGDLFYGIEWRPQEAPPRVEGKEVMAVLAPEGAPRAALLELLSARGVRCHLLVSEPSGTVESFARQLQSLQSPPRAVVLLAGVLASRLGSAEEDALQLVKHATRWAQAIVAARLPLPARLHVVTRGAVQVAGESAAGLALAEAALWGWGRTLAQELPQHWGGLYDVDPQLVEESLPLLALDLLCAREHAEGVAYRWGRRFVPHLVRARPESSGRDTRPLVLRGDASYIVTGGQGAIGLQVAEWAVARGARHLVLASRGEPDATAHQAVERMRATGARVHCARCDVGDREEVAALVARASEEAPIRGVIHAAGILRDGALLSLDDRRIAQVLRPKLAGARNLEIATARLPLDFFVLFSSLAGVVGSAGQAAYAAANAFLGALARRRRQAGRHALALDWGPWTVGMASRTEGTQRWHRQGVGSLTPTVALAALEQALRQDAAQLTVAAMDWTRASGSLGDVRAEDVLPPASRRPAASGAELITRLRSTPGPRRERFLAEFLTAELNTLLGRDPRTPIDPQAGLSDLGIDSLLALDLHTLLEKQVEQALPATLAFDFPNVGALTGYLLALLESRQAGTASAPRNEVVATSPPPEPDTAELAVELDALK
ncbi:type I polyketide synthase [Corallococcus llansteffanensis]|uniref:SDR family NAD(P)-dependent oxidoreductase n=1 Tax=Corallococcus llansteffanensis TaxID=2316731 RepID=A0A3A8P2S9_9BACT|nr:SDR family NAD(P)-dependent oxidoreductase [Corallococcus llansteffanensis]RKH50139.1 SDR family NAD(P)-dependent oxidoreductase [Corallococcus llansteffanensis]